MSRERRHKNVLRPSRTDIVLLAEAVESRFIELCDVYFRIKGEELIPPKFLDKDMLRWRQMRVRHKRGDLRHTEAEEKSTKAVAQWTVDVNCEIRNQPPKTVEWGQSWE